MSGAAAAPDAAARAARDAARAKRDERRLRWLVPAGTWLIRALAATWRVRVHGREAVEALRAAGQPYVYVLWHGELLPLAWFHGPEGAAVLVSTHRDGETIARIIQRLGLRTIRGSSNRGAARALLAMVAALEAGTSIAVTPDGPRGPAHSFQPGALVAAQRAGVPIVPVTARASRAWRFRSWDRFLVPKPFARVTIAYAAPTRVRAASAREAPDEAPRFAALLDDAGRAAERLLGGVGA